MIRGVVKFKNPGAVPTGQSIKLTVQDTSRVGADAIRITQTELTIPEDFDADKDALPFEIDIAGQLENYTISGHLARHHGQDIRLGDLITMGAIPVSDDSELEVMLRLVV